MPHEVRGPDGQWFSFPDDMSDADVNSRMQANYANHPQYGGQPGTLAPYEAPGEGTATPLGGAVQPNTLTRPGYMSREDRRLLMMGMMFPELRGMMEHFPGVARETENQRALGRGMAERELEQDTGRTLLDILHNTVAAHALHDYRPYQPLVDPKTGRMLAAPGFNEAVGSWNADPTFQRWRERLLGNAIGTEEGYNLHTDLMHGIGQLTNAFTQSGAGTSNQRQTEFKNMFGDMMQATSPEKFYRILMAADNYIRKRYHLGEAGMPVVASPQGSGVAQPAPGPAVQPRRRATNPQTGAVETLTYQNGQWLRPNGQPAQAQGPQ